jgi:hypothetical protein
MLPSWHCAGVRHCTHFLLLVSQCCPGQSASDEHWKTQVWLLVHTYAGPPVQSVLVRHWTQVPLTPRVGSHFGVEVEQSRSSWQPTTQAPPTQMSPMVH